MLGAVADAFEVVEVFGGDLFDDFAHARHGDFRQAFARAAGIEPCAEVFHQLAALGLASFVYTAVEPRADVFHAAIIPPLALFCGYVMLPLDLSLGDRPISWRDRPPVPEVGGQRRSDGYVAMLGFCIGRETAHTMKHRAGEVPKDLHISRTEVFLPAMGGKV